MIFFALLLGVRRCTPLLSLTPSNKKTFENSFRKYWKEDISWPLGNWHMPHTIHHQHHKPEEHLSSKLNFKRNWNTTAKGGLTFSRVACTELACTTYGNLCKLRKRISYGFNGCLKLMNGIAQNAQRHEQWYTSSERQGSVAWFTKSINFNCTVVE